jgi:hypothetical protein
MSQEKINEGKNMMFKMLDLITSHKFCGELISQADYKHAVEHLGDLLADLFADVERDIAQQEQVKRRSETLQLSSERKPY